LEECVIESDGVLRHLAFFEELGRMDEGDAGWRAVSAGLVTMRLVDRWVAVGSTDRLDAWSVSSAREAIARVSDTTPTRRILTSVVDVMVACTATDMHALSPRLMAYGQGLEYDAKWALAADVYTTIVSNTHPVEDADLAVAASLQLGFCWRNIGDFALASAAYTQAATLAKNANDPSGVIRGKLGHANIATERGNLPAAEVILDEAIVEARSNGLDDVLWRALASRAFVAGNRGEHHLVIRLSHDALRLSKSPRDRDRSLSNIATAFRYLGALDAATKAHTLLAATAQEQAVRLNSTINLLDIAARQGSELVFDRYRRELECVEMTPQLKTTFLIYAGRGYALLGRPADGIPYLKAAIENAKQFSFNQLLFEAESALTASERQDAETRVAPEMQATAEHHDVLDTIREMMEVAGIV